MSVRRSEFHSSLTYIVGNSEFDAFVAEKRFIENELAIKNEISQDIQVKTDRFKIIRLQTENNLKLWVNKVTIEERSAVIGHR